MPTIYLTTDQLRAEAPDAGRVIGDDMFIGCAPRPFPARATWQGPFRAGIFYGASPRHLSGGRWPEPWANLHVTPVAVVTVEEARGLLDRAAAKAAEESGCFDGLVTSFAELADEAGHRFDELAADLGYRGLRLPEWGAAR